MSFDQNTLPRMIEGAEELIQGTQEENPGFVDDACDVKERSAQRGEIQFIDTAETLPRDFGSGVAGQDARLIDSGLTNAPYNMEVYDLGYRFTEEEQEDFSQFGSDMVDEHMPLLISNVETAITVNARAELDAETNTFGVLSGAWNLPTASIQEDILIGVRENVPGADLCVVGAFSADDMKLHADFKAGVSFYADRSLLGDGDTDAALIQVLKNKFGFKKVIIARQKRNTAAEGQTAVLGYIFPRFFWAGNQKGFRWIKQKNTDSRPRFVNNVRAGNSLEMFYKRVGDVQRLGTDNGVLATNIG